MLTCFLVKLWIEGLIPVRVYEAHPVSQCNLSSHLTPCKTANKPNYQMLNYSFNHPSIFYTRLIRPSGRGGAGAYPSGHRARGGVHPGQVASPSQGHTETNKTNNHSLTLTPKDNFRDTN